MTINRCASGRHPAQAALLVALLVCLTLAACSAGGAPGASPGSSGTPGPGPSATPGAPMTAGELRLELIDHFGSRWYCDPDSFPVSHGDEQTNAIAAFPEMVTEGVVFAAVVDRLGLTSKTTFSDAEKLSIYHLWKVAVSIPLEPIGNGMYRFDYLAEPVAPATEGTRSSGTISEAGEIVVEVSAPAGEPNCPICLARGTLIDTPSGRIAVDQLRLGDPVWTLDPAGRRVAGTVIALGSTPAPADHHVIQLTLADGRTVTASPGHPLADGRLLGDAGVGDLVDGSIVVGAERLPYGDGETFDIAVSGPTGMYVAGGIPMASTLAVTLAGGEPAP